MVRSRSEIFSGDPGGGGSSWQSRQGTQSSCLHYPTNSEFKFHTRVASFKFPTCK
jgi:hypothetical protein